MLCIREATEMLDFDADQLPEGLLGGMFVQMRHFKSSLATVNPSTLRDTFVEMPKTTWDDIGGLFDTKKQLKELI